MLDDAYTYPNSGGVLRNRVGKRTREQVELMESRATAIAWPTFARLSGDPDLGMLRDIHRRLLQDIYAWAGEFRFTNVFPGGGAPAATYCRHEEVEPGMEYLFARLEADDFLRGLDELDFLMKLDAFWGKLTRLHPFRDGNTRSQVAFVGYLARQAGHPIDWEKAKLDGLQRARIAAANGAAFAIERYLETRMLPLGSSATPDGLSLWSTSEA